MADEGTGASSLTDRAKQLRASSTEAERCLWHSLRDRRFMGLKFRRQVPMAGYIADFVCVSPRLVIELDGGQHVDNAAYDQRRDQSIRDLGFVVLRFWNHQVLNDTDAVLQVVRHAVLKLVPDLEQGPQT